MFPHTKAEIITLEKVYQLTQLSASDLAFLLFELTEGAQDGFFTPSDIDLVRSACKEAIDRLQESLIE